MSNFYTNLDFDYIPNMVRFDDGKFMDLKQYRQMYGKNLKQQPKIIDTNGNEVLDVNSTEVLMNFDLSYEKIPQEDVIDEVYYFTKFYFIEILEGTESVEGLELGSMKVAFEYDLDNSIELSIGEHILGKIRDGVCKELFIKMFKGELDVKPAAILYGINKRDKLIKMKMALLVYKTEGNYAKKIFYDNMIEAKLTDRNSININEPISLEIIRNNPLLDEILHEEYVRLHRKRKNKKRKFCDEDYDDIDEYDDELYVEDYEDLYEYDDQPTNLKSNKNDYITKSLYNKTSKTDKTTSLFGNSTTQNNTKTENTTKGKKKNTGLIGADKVLYEEAVKFYGKSYSSHYQPRDLINKYIEDDKRK